MMRTFQRNLGPGFRVGWWQVSAENWPFAPFAPFALSRAGAVGSGQAPRRGGYGRLWPARKAWKARDRGITVERHQGWALEQAALWREKRRGVAVAGVGGAAARLRGVCGGTAAVRNPQCFLWSWVPREQL